MAAYIATYYYVAVSNVAAQGYLPALEELGEDDTAKVLVDQSYRDFGILERTIGDINEPLLSQSTLSYLYQEALTRWKPLVKDSTGVYRARSEPGR